MSLENQKQSITKSTESEDECNKIQYIKHKSHCSLCGGYLISADYKLVCRKCGACTNVSLDQEWPDFSDSVTITPIASYARSKYLERVIDKEREIPFLVRRNVKRAFKDTHRIVERECLGSGQKFISYAFIIRKLLDLTNAREYIQLFKRIKTKKKVKFYNEIWKTVCIENNWNFNSYV